MNGAHAQTRFPRRTPGRAMALSEDPVVLDGQRVMFDEEVLLTPVRVEKRERRDRRERSR